MKTKVLFLAFLSLSVLCFAQTQTYLKITLDTKQMGNPDCNLNEGMVPDDKVYLHSGLCTTGDVYCKTQITPFQSDVWEHVVGNWGDEAKDDSVGLMTKHPTEAGVWFMEMIVEDYFSDPLLVNVDSGSGPMTPGATPYTMGLVFRDFEGLFSGRDDQCRDIFITDIVTGDPKVIQGSDPTLQAPFPAVSLDIAINVDTEKIIRDPLVYPNPFSDNLTFDFFIKKPISNLEIRVYNILGKEVAELFSGFGRTGHHLIHWDGSGYSGDKLPEGVYLIQLNSEEAGQITKRVVLSGK